MQLYFFPVFAMLEALFLIYLTRGMHIGFKFLFNMLAIYWIISFFLRPVFYLLTNSRDLTSFINDSRLRQNPGGFGVIMSLVIIGNAIFCAVLLMYSKRPKKYQVFGHESSPISSSETLSALKFGLIIGIVSLFLENTQFQNPFSKSLFPLIYVTFCSYIWMRPDLTVSKPFDFGMFIAGTSGTLFISIVDNNSKGVILMPVLIFIIRVLSKKMDIRRRNFVLLIIPLAFIAIPIFNRLQENKLGSIALKLANLNSEKLPGFMSPFLPLLQRFDQFARVGDAYFANQHTLGSFFSWWKFIIQSLQWNPSSGRSELSFGQIWNQQVSNQSIYGSRFSNVSLAQGPIAEGYVWNGVTSMLIECAIVALIFVVVGRFLAGSVYGVMFAFGVIGNGRLFENGTVALAAGISSALKFVLFILIFSKLLLPRDLRSQRFKSSQRSSD